MSDMEDVSDWEALSRFRRLGTDAERLEQMFMTSLASSRTSRQNGQDLRLVKDAVQLQNGRVGKLELRWIQGAAVIAFLLVVIPMALAAVALTR